MNLSGFLQEAEQGNLGPCQRCPWSPTKLDSVAFGTSCLEHGVDYSLSSRAVSVAIAQDPGNTTPEKTGRLCSVHNSRESSDSTAQNGLSLWKATVSRGQVEANDPYLQGHYWTNAIMHGALKPFRSEIETARKCCSSVLRDQLEALKPKVVIATGQVATNSLFEVGLLSRSWNDLKSCFSTRAYSESASLFGAECLVFCTYHTTGRVVNGVGRRLYSPHTENLLSRRLEKIEEQEAIRDFLASYPKESTCGRGMRVLLMHWLDIGDAIRKAHAVDASTK